jgi:predicted acyl esterase
MRATSTIGRKGAELIALSQVEHSAERPVMNSSPVRLFVPMLLVAQLLRPAQGEEPWTRQKTAVEIPMRDGQVLIADVYLPERPGRYPTVLVQTPYSRKRMGAALPDDKARESLFDRDHYAVVVLDWRGFYDSKSARVVGERPQIGKDGYDAVEWVARQPWSDGKVGTWGPSALGRVQFATAAEQPPHLVCCVPLVAPDGYTYADYYENGVLREADIRMLDKLGFGLGAVVRPASKSSAPLYALAARAAHPERFNVPMLLITGWYDHGLERQMETFEVLRTRSGEPTRTNTKLVIGPWHHMAVGKARQGALEYPGAAGERDRASQQFLDHWLRGETNSGWDQAAVVRWWQMGEERWLSAGSLAAIKTAPVTFDLGVDGTLQRRESTAGATAGIRRFVSDPKKPVPTIGGANLGQDSRGGTAVVSGVLVGDGLLAGPQDQAEVEQRDDVLVYTTAPLTEPLRMFGRVAVNLAFAIDQKDASFAVRLCDVYPDGRSMLVCDSIARATYRQGTDETAAVEPGQTYTLTLRLPPTALTVVAGHRLRISIAGSNYPRYELNSNTGADHFDAATAVAVKCSVLHGGAQASTLNVPLLEGH